MGLLDKVKDTLFESDPTDIKIGGPGSIPQELLNIEVPNVSVNIDTKNVLAIEDIYENANLSDKEKSVYKVEEIKNSLGSLPKDSMKAATLGMMTVVKLTAEEVQVDAANRTEALLQALTQYSNETARIKSDMEITIAEMEEKIDRCKQGIAQRELEQEKSQETVTAELDRIKTTADFIA